MRSVLARLVVALVALSGLSGCAAPVSPADTAAPAPTGPTSDAGRSLSDEVDLSGPVTVEACVHLALRRAPDLAAFEAQVAAAEAQVVTARTWPNPTLAATAIDVGQTDRALAQLQLTYPVLFAWTRGLQERVARAGLEGADLAVDEERRLIAARVGEVYFDVLAADELVASELAALETARELSALLSRRAALGDASLLDAERARAEELEALRLADVARERLEVSRLLLAQLIGARQPAAVRLAPAWPGLAAGRDDASLAERSEGEEIPAEEDLDHLVAVALERRPDVQRARTRQEQARLTVELEERRAHPLADVALTVGARSGAEGSTGVIGISVPLPAFDTNQGGQLRALAEARGAAAEVARAERLVRLEVETALVACRRARRRLEELALPLAESRDRALALARRLFEGGELSPTDLVLIERDAVVARRALVMAYRDVAGARWRLRVATGEVLPQGR